MGQTVSCESGGTVPPTIDSKATTEIELVSTLETDYFDDLRDVLQKDCKIYNKTLECYQLAQFYEYRDNNFPEAVKLYARLCDTRNHGASCLSRGMLERNGRGLSAPEKDQAAAMESFVKACKYDDAKGCQNAGLLSKIGAVGVPKDQGKALDFFGKACEGGEPNGCFYVGLMHLNGAEDTPADKFKALMAFSKACKLGHPWACANASRMCRIGDGVDVNEEQAERFKIAAINLNYQSQRVTETTK
eukprot:m.262807 g.262807  ORF g.262807 m.262807 type:complete len:246 (+) comp47038_c0_seq1:130-867(+)